MKIISLTSKTVYDLDLKKANENPMPCPDCDANRKHKGSKSFSFNAKKGTGFCLNCESRFVEYRPFVKKIEYIVPQYKNKTDLSDNAVKWFSGRMINQDTLAKMKVYSDTEFMPQINKSTGVICFPYFYGDTLVNIKYRDNRKNFKLVKDAELILYNINCLEKATEVIITEGEIDCLSFIEVGIENCISVPNGANKNLEYLDDYIELFDNINKIYIASDNDIKGIELKSELIKRFGQEKCFVVNFKDCKDANEYLQSYGGIELANTIKNAKEIKVDGIVDINNIYDETHSLFITGLEKGKGIGFSELDDIVTWETGRVCVTTGIPSHGKSEFVDFLLTKLNILHGWKSAYFSPENYPIKYHLAKLISKLTGKKFESGYLTVDDFDTSFEYIKNNFFFIYPEEDMTFDNILSKARIVVKKHGIKVLVFDPFNKIEHLLDKGESETLYISKFLDKCSNFAKKHDVLVIIVAHPTKMKKTPIGVYEIPTLYDINGSANWYNKADYGLCVYRDFTNNTTTVIAQKVKFRHLGSGGSALFKFNYNNGRYEKEYLTIDKWDSRSYLNPEEVIEEPEIVYTKPLMPNNEFDKVENEEYEEQFNRPPNF